MTADKPHVVLCLRGQAPPLTTDARLDRATAALGAEVQLVPGTGS